LIWRNEIRSEDAHAGGTRPDQMRGARFGPSRHVNTDSSEFMDHVPAISLRENERGMQIGAGWNPHYHQATDRFSSYSDKDFRLGLNAAQTTLGAVAELTGVSLKK
jgi:hypothetical protein